MDSSKRRSSRILKFGAIGILVFCGASCMDDVAVAADAGAGSALISPAPAQAIPPLAPNDVSWLFPAPTRAEDFDKLISMGDLTAPNPQDPTKRDPVWPDAAFQQFLAIAASPAAQVAGTPIRIGLPVEAQSKNAWFIAGIRLDAGAPGLSNEIRGQFGQSPQVRLIIQLVTRKADGTPDVHDIAGHLIFGFVAEAPDPPAQAGCLPQPIPDLVAFRAIVAELAALRTKLSDGQLGTDRVTTSGVPLGVHPGLVDATTSGRLRQEIKSFLERHISGQRLNAMAIMGLPEGAFAPWIFLSMLGVPPGVIPTLPNGGFVPVHGPTLDGQQFAQMLEPIGTSSLVVPQPHTNNLDPITCKNAAAPVAGPPIGERNGSSTAELFADPPPAADRITAVLDLIADPTRSHFFNTDCVSCHTETRRAMELLNIQQVSGVDPAVLPNGPYNVRNFGWSPPIEGQVQATVTRRTAAETAAVVTFINSEILGK
jgi:hypothetical protein